MAVDDEGLRAVEHETIAAALRAQRDLRGRMFAVFVDAQSDELLACRDPREKRERLRATGRLQRRRGDDAGREKRRRREIAADLFHHNRGFRKAEAGAAFTLADQQAGKAHRSAFPPRVARKAVGVIGVAQFAQMSDRRLVGKEAARRVAEKGLIFGEGQGHGSVHSSILILRSTRSVRLEG